jgi:hypothetical protein
LPFLVKLPVIWQVSLGRHAEDASAIDHHRAIEELRVEPQGRADNQHRGQSLALFHEPRERGFGGLQQRVLVEQIFVRVSGNAEFRKERDGDLRGGSLPRQLNRAVRVELRVRDAQRGNAHGRPDKPV